MNSIRYTSHVIGEMVVIQRYGVVGEGPNLSEILDGHLYREFGMYGIAFSKTPYERLNVFHSLIYQHFMDDKGFKYLDEVVGYPGTADAKVGTYVTEHPDGSHIIETPDGLLRVRELKLRNEVAVPTGECDVAYNLDGLPNGVVPPVRMAAEAMEKTVTEITHSMSEQAAKTTEFLDDIINPVRIPGKMLVKDDK